jgi:hypothetical protein
MQVDALPINTNTNTNTNTIGVGLSRLESSIRLPSDRAQSISQPHRVESSRVESSQMQSSQLERSLLYYPITLTSATTVDMSFVTCESGVYAAPS